MALWCVDDRHGTPCPLPCSTCALEDCDPKAQVAAETVEGAMRAAGWSDEYIADALKRLSHQG